MYLLASKMNFFMIVYKKFIRILTHILEIKDCLGLTRRLGTSILKLPKIFVSALGFFLDVWDGKLTKLNLI